MKGAGVAMTVGGWALAVGGLLMSDATGLRMALALIGLAVSMAGVFTLNAGHLEHAIWKARRS
jgi:hypothetical protein